MKGKFKRSIAFLIVFMMIISANIGAYATIIETQDVEEASPGDTLPPQGEDNSVEPEKATPVEDKGEPEDPEEPVDNPEEYEEPKKEEEPAGNLEEPIGEELTSYIVRYMSEEESLLDDKIVEGQPIDSEVTEYAKDIKGYVADEDSKTITLQETDNIITFHYTLIKGLRPTELISIVDGVTIKVSAEEGVLPEGTELSVKPVPEDDMDMYLDAIESNEDILLGHSAMFDITLLDMDGNEIQPDGEVLVEFADLEFSNEDGEIFAYHIDPIRTYNNSKSLKSRNAKSMIGNFSLNTGDFFGDDMISSNEIDSKDPEYISMLNDIETNDMVPSIVDNKISFNTKHFSIYIVGTNVKHENKNNRYELLLANSIQLEERELASGGTWSISSGSTRASISTNSTDNRKAIVKANATGDVEVRYRVTVGKTTYNNYFYINIVANPYRTSNDTITPATTPDPDPSKLPPGTVAASKTAKWVDYGERIAEITLNVEGMPIVSGSDVILVMDVSGSMKDNDRIETAQEASKEFIDDLLGAGNPFNNRVAFIPFHGSSGGTGETSTVTAGSLNFSYDRNLLNNHVDATLAKGGTNYTAALDKALNYSNSRTTAEKARPLYVVFMSDGAPGSNGQSPNDLNWNGITQADALKGSNHNAKIYTVGIQLTGNGTTALQNISSIVNGNKLYKSVTNMSDLDPILETIVSEIKKAGEDAVFKDYISQYFDYYTASPDHISAETYDDSDRSVTITVGEILEGKKTFKIYVKLKNEYHDEQEYPTNNDIKLNYKDVNGNPAEKGKEIGDPKLPVGYGTIKIKYVLVNSSGNYIDGNGTPAEYGYRVFVPTQGYEQAFSYGGSTQLNVEQTYDVSPDVPSGYSLYSGEDSIKQQELTINNRNAIVEFKVVSSPKQTLVYNANGGTGSMPNRVEPTGTTFNLDANLFTKSGYTFTGWNTEADGSGTGYANESSFTMPAGGDTLYAQWSAADQTLVYDANGGTGTMPNRVEPTDTTFNLNTNIFTKTGYTFTGWNTEANGSGTGYANEASFTMPATDLTVYAQWTINEYTLTYADSMSEDVYGTQDYDYQEAVVALEDPTKEGYTFAGWLPLVPLTMPATDLTVYAQWTINEYTLTYADSMSEDVYGTQDYDYQEAVVALEDPTKEGYTFAGWLPLVPLTMPATDLTVYAQWTINEYTLTYADSMSEDVYGTQDYDYQEAVVALEDPTKEGYTFAGWLPLVPLTMPATDLTVYAQWTINEYTLTYADSMSEDVYGTQDYDYQEAVVALEDPTKEGYTFAGWLPLVPLTMPATDLTVYAQWTINEYTLTYADSMSEDVYGTQDYDYQEAVVALEDPTKEGYTFAGWLPLVPLTMPATDLTVYAQWTINEYTLTYADSMSEDVYGTQDYDYQEAVVALEDPTKEGYTFAGWLPLVPLTMPATDLTVYAQWTINEYTLTYADSMSEDVYGTQDYDYQEAVVALEDPTKEGYTFAGWLPLVPLTMPATDLTVYAQWTINEYTLTYADSMSEDVYGTQDYDYQEAVVALEDPTKEGYTFAGWLPLVPLTMPATDLTVYAQWTINEYTLTYADSMSEDVYGTQDYDYQEAVVALEDPTKEGYTFAGWLPLVPLTMPATDLTVYAQWTINEYTLTYADSMSEDVYGTQDYDYQEAVVALEDPTKEGYTFAGWLPLVPLTMPATDLTVYAQWTINEYTLTYADSMSEDVYGTQDYDYQEAVVALEDPTKEGYTFAGWVPLVPLTMPANDVTVKAQWVGFEIVKTGTYVSTEEAVKVGDTINYEIKVKNIGNVTLTKVAVSDPMLGETIIGPTDDDNGTLDVGETWTYTGSYIIKQIDLDAGNVINEVTVLVTYQDEDGEEVELPGIETETTNLEQEPSLTVIKSANKTQFTSVGETITYTYKVTNTGNITLTDFTIEDDKIPTIDMSSAPETLAPFGTFTITATYSITSADYSAGSVTNMASAKAGNVVSEPVQVTVNRKSTGGGGGGRDDDDEEIIDEPVPEALPELNKEDHFQYIQGYPDNTVRPEGLITREEVAAVFYRLLANGYRNSIWTQNHKFSDVKSSRWSNKHIATLANGGIITGYPDGTFKPGNFITRAELATIASRFDNLSPFVSDSFSDISGHWANKYINSSVQKGWVNGYPDGTFKPNQYITRAEFVTLVNAVLERRVHKEDILTDARKFPDLLGSKWYYEQMQESINSHYYNRLEDTYEEWTEIYYPNLDM